MKKRNKDVRIDFTLDDRYTAKNILEWLINASVASKNRPFIKFKLVVTAAICKNKKPTCGTNLS